MRTKSCKNRNYTSKGKTTQQKITDNKNKNDSEPLPILQNTSYKMEIADAKKWYELHNRCCY